MERRLVGHSGCTSARRRPRRANSNRGWARARYPAQDPTTSFRDTSAARSGPVRPREDFITIDRSDDQTAFIKVRCQLPPRYFTDYLVAMKLNDGWKIVSKSYRYDLRE